MGERIYIMNGKTLVPMEEKAFDLEDTLQALIADHPDLLDGTQMTPENPRRWILVTREKGIAETADTSARWAVDHLFIDQEARPTLVEVKRGSNTEIRRNVIGQMLEYAAHAANTWTANELRSAFESAPDPDGRLRELLEDEEEPDADAFWNEVATNLQAKNLRLLFVADKIPDELARVVEFLNDQMSRTEVLAVEIKQFVGASDTRTQTLVPRVIGRTAAPASKTSASRQKMTRELFMEEMGDDRVREAADRLLRVARDNGATLEWGANGVSVRARCSLWSYAVTVAWLYPPGRPGWFATEDFSFGAATFVEYDPPPGEELRSFLEEWLGQFEDDDFGRYVSAKSVRARAVSHEDAAKHADLLAERLAKVLNDLQSL